MIAIVSASLFNGICWEMWNFFSSPQWIYNIPYVGFWKIFEMPILGYLGYPFFGLIVFSYTSILSFVIFGRKLSTIVAADKLETPIGRGRAKTHASR